MSSSNIILKDELVRDWVKLVPREELKELLADWGHNVKEEYFSKFEMFKKFVGNKLPYEQFRRFWLLKEKGSFKNRHWTLYRFDSSKMKDFKDLSSLKNKIKTVLNEELKPKIEFQLILEEFKDLGIYLVFDFKGFPRIIEEFGFKFHLHHSIQRIRCLLGENNYIQVSGLSRSKVNLCIKVLEKVLNLKIEGVPIYSYVVRDFIQQMKPIQKLVVVCPREMGGFSGVERITVEGPNVVDGMEDLRSRQEILFNFEGLSKLGAWSIVKTEKAKIDVQGRIRLGDEETKGKILYFLRA